MTIILEQNKQGEVEQKAILGCGLIDALIAFLEQTISKNYYTWTYNASKFKNKIVPLYLPNEKEPFIASFTKDDGTIIFAKEK